MICGTIAISKSVTLLSVEVAYSIIVMNKNIICIELFMWETLISLQAICSMNTISVSVRVLLERWDIPDCNKAFVFTILEKTFLKFF